MTGLNRFLLRIATRIAGRERAEWLNAMAAETEAADEESTQWAAGCLWAAIKDRISRDWRFAAAIVLFPILIFVLQFVLFFPVVWLSLDAGLPRWTFVAVFLLLPLPFSFALARSRPLRGALLGAVLSSLVLDLIGVVTFWIEFGQGPPIWFEKGTQVFNMTPVLGWSCSLAVWLAGAWLGSRSGRAKYA